jgi:hypothetical protein
VPFTPLARLKGRVAPAATNLSPVARDYPSRALSGVFQAPALRLFYQGTAKEMCRLAREVTGLFLANYSPVLRRVCITLR